MEGKTLYITSVITYSGKTSLCLGLGLRMQSQGLNVGYLKPVGTEPLLVDGQLIDQDASFVRQVLRLSSNPSDLSPVVVTDDLLTDIMSGETTNGLSERVFDAVAQARQNHDILLLEGGTSMRDGYVVGLGTVDVVRQLITPTLSVTRWRSARAVLDDILAAKRRLGDNLLGAIINAVPDDAWEIATQDLSRYLESAGIPVYGVLPYQQSLAAVTIQEITDLLEAQVLTGKNLDKLVESLTVGAMTVESALPRFRRQLNKAVVTGGDRADIQAAALETSTAVLVLTGNLHPSPAIVKMAEEHKVAVLLVRQNTIDAVEKIESIFGRTRLGQAEKLNRFQAMLAEHLDYDRLCADLGL